MCCFKTGPGIKTLAFFAVAALLASCRPDVKETGVAIKYFDVAGFFRNDTARLNHSNLQVFKTVTHNGTTESKTVRVSNWGRELDFFISSDINKPAWRDSYTIAGDTSLMIYRARDPELKMRQMLIKKSNGHVKWILIYNRVVNKLYRSYEKLTYYPDSLYLVEKTQKVRFLGTNDYKIKSLIKK